MTIDPELLLLVLIIFRGTRYGDYSKIDLSPPFYKKMYFIDELMFTKSRNVVGRFQIAPNFDTDAGIVDIVAPADVDFSELQDITVTVRNFGVNEISDIPVRYSIDGGTPVTDVVSWTITSGAIVDFTFALQADLPVVGQTYTIESSTALVGDEDPNNDSFISRMLHHLEPNDTGVTAISQPIIRKWFSK